MPVVLLSVIDRRDRQRNAEQSSGEADDLQAPTGDVAATVDGDAEVYGDFER